jgi:hypothetical protein
MAILLMAALAAMEVLIFAVGGRPSKLHRGLTASPATSAAAFT